MQVERRNDGVIMIPRSRIDSTNSGRLKDQFTQVLKEGFTEVTLDCTHVAGIDSSGLGKLLLFQKRLREKDGKLRIINISSDYIKKMFVMIQLHRVIEIAE